MSKKENLILFCRAPEKGKVKTRLAATIGQDAALRVSEYLLSRTIELLARTDFSKTICYLGEGEDYFREFEKDFSLTRQRGDDLGERMYNAIRRSYQQGYSKSILLGSDIVDLTIEDFSDALTSLVNNDIVLGPAKDGGYYLVGMNSPQDIFSGIPWGSSNTLKSTIDKIRSKGLSFALLSQRHDIDREEDLKSFAEHFPELSHC